MKTINDFACRCNNQSEAECDEDIKWALEQLKCTSDKLVSNIIFRLSADYDVDVVEIITDQWSLIRCHNNELSADVQCDMIEDGLACTLRCFVEYFKDLK